MSLRVASSAFFFFLLLLLLLSSAPPLLAQVPGGLVVFGGPALPTGPFAGSDSEDAGLATAGWTFGVDFGIPLPGSRAFAVQSTLGAVTFGVEEDVFGEDMFPGLDLNVGRYWGGLALTGLRYGVPVSEGLAVHATGQLGLVVFKAPSVDVSYEGQSAEMVSYSEPVLGGCLGGGVRIGPRVDVEARYFTLGEPSLEGSLRMSGLPDQDFESEQPVSWLQLTIGVRVL